MAYTKIEIISLALTALGKGPVTSLAGAGEFAAAADNVFDMLLEAELSAGNWRFATAITQLSQLVATPPSDEWTYAYQLPGNYLACLKLDPHIDYQIYEDKIYTNTSTTLYMEYRFKPEYSRLPSYFVKFFMYELASYLALAVANQPKYADQMQAKRDDAYALASFADSSSHPAVGFQNNPFIDVRYNGGGTFRG